MIKKKKKKKEGFKFPNEMMKKRKLFRSFYKKIVSLHVYYLPSRLDRFQVK